MKKLAKFYFKSYDMIIGEASNVRELGREMRRLSEQFPKAGGISPKGGPHSSVVEFYRRNRNC